MNERNRADAGNSSVLIHGRSIAHLAGVIAVLVGFLVLAGWMLDIEIFKHVLPGLVAMNPLTALAFVLAGAALCLLPGPGPAHPRPDARPQHPQSRRLVQSLGGIIALIGMLKLAELFFGWETGIDQVLFRAKLDAGGSQLPNRMAPNTALNFALLGCTLLLLHGRTCRAREVSQLLALPVALLSLLAVIGYMYRAPSLYGIGAFIPMALHTALVFLVLTIGVLGARTDCGLMSIVAGQDAGGAMARRLLPAAIVVPVATGWLRLHGQRIGLYSFEFGVVLHTLANILVFVALIWLNARSLHRTDARRRQVEAALQEAKDEADQARESAERAREEAEAANNAKSEFLSRMSHELRTPLNAILGFGQVLEMDDLRPEQRDSVKHILKAGTHLLGLINEVLDIARIEAGQLSVSVEPVSVAEVLRESLDLVRPAAQHRRIELGGADAAVGFEPHFVLADRQRLKQVVLNLLSNAIKYNRDGGSLSLSFELSPDGRILIKMSDTGPGLAPDKLARLFTPFDRLGAEQSGVEGTGIGLALSKRLVELMGGVIRADSVPGQGSTFSIELPLAQSPVAELDHHSVQSSAPAVNTSDPSAMNGSAASETAHTVLHIEDNWPNLQLIESIIKRRSQFKLLSAMQGGLGLELAREHRPGLILLDLHLPDMGGDEVLRRLQQDPRTESIPVVMVSADATPRQIERLRREGAADYLTKPLDVKRLLAVLDENFKEKL